MLELTLPKELLGRKMSNSASKTEEKQLVVRSLEQEVLSLEAIRLPQDYLNNPLSKGVLVRVPAAANEETDAPPADETPQP